MKVLDTNLAGTTASATPPAGAVTPQSGLSRPHSGKLGNGDRVELSGFAGKLGATLVAQSGARAARVAALAQAYQSGRYRPDAHATSRAMIQETLGASAAEKDT